MRLGAIVTLALAGCAASAGEPDERVVAIVATAEAKGTPEPCGCTSDPLGDIARVVTLARGALLVDAGSLLYDRESAAPEKRRQADAKAQLLARVYAKAGGDVGLGADDLVHGAKAVAPPRQAANCAGVARAEPRVHTIEGVRIGVFGVVAPSAVEAAKLKASPPEAAARAAVEKLEREGAQVIVALLGMSRADARALMTAVNGIGFGVVGSEVGEGMLEPEPVGGGFLVAPADLLRRAVKLELHVRGGKPSLTLFQGKAACTLECQRLARKIAQLDEQLAAWKKDPTADRAFVAAREKERAAMQAEKRRLETTPPAPPETSYFTYELVDVRRKLARDPAVEKQLTELARDIGRANLAAARKLADPPPEHGGARYVGDGACAKCHKPAVEFWKQTVHAQAWMTLVDVEKQYDYDCVGCHVTGFQKPGGAGLATVEKKALTNVQCEVCHGPASKHVAEAGLEEPKSLTLAPADRFCADNCHTKEHSDTFQLVPYLRDVLGAGHGEKRRAQLGDGPTGHELRSKALAAAQAR